MVLGFELWTDGTLAAMHRSVAVPIVERRRGGGEGKDGQ
jgi:hypothetical protein